MQSKWFVIGLATAIVVVLCAPGACAAAEPTGWDLVPEILAQINPPEFPDRDFDVTDHGAVGDGQTDCKPAIDAATDACHAAGGGRVVVPAGEWFVKGPIHLRSGVNLHVSDGATIRFSSDPNDFLPVVFTRFEGNELMNFSPPVYAFEQQNIAITGGGTLDGGASREAWWPWKGRWGGEIDHGWRPDMPHQGDDTEALRQMGEDDVPARDRVFGAGHRLRPNFVQPYRCKNVLIEGVTLINSPMWIIHPVLCENVTIRGVTVNSHGPNNDGCNPESSRNVLIEDCFFDTGDDCIAVKAGRNADGRRLGVPSENIIIRRCTMRDGHGGVVFGSEMSGGVRNVFAEDCELDSPNLDRAVRLKSNTMRGGFLENLYVRNLRVGQVADAVVRINLHYDRDRGDHPPRVENVYIEDIIADKSRYPFYLVGLDEEKIRNVVIENCTFRNAERPSVFENVEQVTLKNFRQLPAGELDRN